MGVMCRFCGADAEPVRGPVILGELVITTESDVFWRGRRVQLRPGARILVETLARNPGRWVHHDVLLNRMGSESGTNVISVTVSRTRAAFREIDPDFDAIETDSSARHNGSRGRRWAGEIAG